MKKTLLIISAMTLLGVYASQAQKFRSGIKGGFNYSSLYIDEVEDQNIRPGFHAGLFAQTELAEIIGLQTELLYTTAGNRSTYNFGPFDGTVDFNLNYIQIPVMLNLKFLDALEVHAGPYVSVLLGASTTTEGDFGDDYTELDRDNFSTLDYGVAAGVGVNFGDLQAGLRYNLGLNEVADSDQARDLMGDVKNVVGQLYIALGF